MGARGGVLVVGGWFVVVVLVLGRAGAAYAQLPRADAVDGFPDWFLGTVIGVLSSALALFGAALTWFVARYFANLQAKLLELDQMKVKLDQIINALPNIGEVDRTLADHETRLDVVEARCSIQHEVHPTNGRRR